MKYHEVYIEQKEIGVVEYKNLYFAGVKRLVDKEGSLYGHYYEDNSCQKNWFELDIPMEYHEKFKDIKDISFTDTGVICHGFQKLTECTNRMQELNIQIEKNMETTNNIKYSVRKELSEDSYIKVDIRLNDECKNGFEEFAITGIYRNKTDKISGCIHDKIAKHFPEFKIFIELHLSDYKGMPTYSVENGFYFLENGKKKVLMEHLRISEEECDKIAGMTVNKRHFSYLIQKMGLPERWKQEADKAIKMLEELTGKKFESRATKPRKFEEFSTIEIQEFENMVYNGYYSFENFKKREKEKRTKEKENLLEKLKIEMEKKVIPVQEEYAVKKHLVELDIPINNFIYYTHSREGAFNWMEYSYDKMISEDEFKEIMSKIDMSKLPNGVRFTCKKFRR